MNTNKNDANKTEVLSALQHLRESLEQTPEDPVRAAALDQCTRLALALEQSHAEGIRFAAFTVLRTVKKAGAGFPNAVHEATRVLTDALERGGFPH
jgi:hypothetical protein